MLLVSCAAPVWQKVDLAERRGELPEAIAIIQAHLNIFPGDARAWYRLGEIRARLSQWPEMNAAFDRCDSLDSRWSGDIRTSREYYWRENINKGLEAMQARDWPLSRTCFEDAITILPRRALPYRLLAETALAAGETGPVADYLNAALERDSTDTRARRLLMVHTFDADDFAAALAQARRLLMVNPADVEALRYQAYALDRINDPEAARAAYRALVSRSRRSADQQSFAAFLYRQGAYPEAVQASRAALASGGDPLANRRAIAQVYLSTQNFPELAEVAREMLEIDPENVAALQLLQIAQAALGNYHKAEKTHLKIEALKSETP